MSPQVDSGVHGSRLYGVRRLDAVLDRVGSGLRKSIAAFAAADYVEYGGSTPLSTA